MRMREAAFKRHPYCALCGAAGPKVRLELHHKLSWTDFPELRFNVHNISVLCHRCHMDQKAAHSSKRRRAKPLSNSQEAF